MYPIFITPKEQKLPKPEDIKIGVKSTKKTLDEDLNNQEKIDDYTRSKELQDNIVKVLCKIINPGIYYIIIGIIVFCIYLLYKDKDEVVIAWIDRFFYMVIGGLVFPYIKKTIKL